MFESIKFELQQTHFLLQKVNYQQIYIFIFVSWVENSINENTLVTRLDQLIELQIYILRVNKSMLI